MKQKILIVEDDVVIRQLVAKNLRNWNYEVAESEDFRLILEQTEAFQPHLILMDIGLLFLMVITGVKKFARCQVFQFSFFHHEISLWIL